MATVDPHQDDFGELLARLRADSTHLVKSEVALAKREAEAQIEDMSKRVAAAAVAGAIAHVGAVLIAGGIALLLDFVMPLWAAALIVGVAACAAAAIVAQRQKKQLEHITSAPKRAAQRVQTDYQTVKEAAQ